MITKPALFRIHALAMLAVLMFSGTGHAAQQIEWDTLLPKLPPLENPLAHLTVDQSHEIGTVAWARSLSAEERRLTAAFDQFALDDAEKYEQNFKKAGFSIDELLEKYRAWSLAKSKRQKAVNTSLGGQDIKMAGYLLPLKFSEEGETEFLLVPYVGACVHTPPPPPNQIVFVRLAKKMVVEELYIPVWVTGRLQTKSSSRSVEFGDGNRSVDVGYHIEKGTVEAYKQ